MAPVLPRLSVFKSKYSGKYLRYAPDEAKQRRHIRCDGEESYNPFSKFKVETAKNRKFVHIKCCYNNKYLRRSNEDKVYIVAEADEVEEDRSKWSCTLFEFMFKSYNEHDIYYIEHVQSGDWACYSKSDDEYNGCFIIKSVSDTNDGEHCFTATDWESLVILPKHVAFKGDNGKYLVNSGDHMQFGATDVGDYRIGDQIITDSDGSISIKHDLNGKFWTANPNWIHLNSDSNSSSATKFWPVKLQGNAIALRSLQVDRFLRRNTDNGNENGSLCAESWATTIDRQSHLFVEELVKKRKIYGVEYWLEDAIVYGESILTLARSCVTNITQQTEEVSVTMSYKEASKSEWSTAATISSSMSMGVSMGIPLIMDAKVAVKDTFEGEYGWGTTMDRSRTLTKTIPVSVPPMTKTIVTLVATLGSCNVPFSYTQQDTLTNGEMDASVKHDGIYTGINCFKFRTEKSEEKL